MGVATHALCGGVTSVNSIWLYRALQKGICQQHP